MSQIIQARVASAIGHFETDFLKKYGLRKYYSFDYPAIFFGCYNKDVKPISQHKGIGIIVWAGNDAAKLHKRKDALKLVRSRKNFFHVSISKSIHYDLSRLKIPHVDVPVSPTINDQYKPTPLGDSVFFYASHVRRWDYGVDTFEQVKARMPDIKFIVGYSHSPGRFPASEMPAVYGRCFMGLRLTRHDGLSNTVIQLGLMGRKCVWNGYAPNAIHYSTITDICNAITEEKKKIGTTDTILPEECKKFFDAGTAWLDTDYYKNAHL